MAPYSKHQRHSTLTKYEDKKEDDNPENNVISIEFIKTSKHHIQACHRMGMAMFTSHPDASLVFSMFINLIKLSLTISFHSLYTHLNSFNKIDIVICNFDQYGDMDWKFDNKFAYCK